MKKTAAIALLVLISSAAVIFLLPKQKTAAPKNVSARPAAAPPSGRAAMEARFKTALTEIRKDIDDNHGPRTAALLAPLLAGAEEKGLQQIAAAHGRAAAEESIVHLLNDTEKNVENALLNRRARRLERRINTAQAGFNAAAAPYLQEADKQALQTIQAQAAAEAGSAVLRGETPAQVNNIIEAGSNKVDNFIRQKTAERLGLQIPQSPAEGAAMASPPPLPVALPAEIERALEQMKASVPVYNPGSRRPAAAPAAAGSSARPAASAHKGAPTGAQSPGSATGAGQKSYSQIFEDTAPPAQEVDAPAGSSVEQETSTPARPAAAAAPAGQSAAPQPRQSAPVTEVDQEAVKKDIKNILAMLDAEEKELKKTMPAEDLAGYNKITKPFADTLKEQLNSKKIDIDKLIAAQEKYTKEMPVFKEDLGVKAMEKNIGPDGAYSFLSAKDKEAFSRIAREYVRAAQSIDPALPEEEQKKLQKAADDKFKADTAPFERQRQALIKEIEAAQAEAQKKAQQAYAEQEAKREQAITSALAQYRADTDGVAAAHPLYAKKIKALNMEYYTKFETLLRTSTSQEDLEAKLRLQNISYNSELEDILKSPAVGLGTP